MQALSNKSSVLALVEETTEGSPVKPSSGNDYVVLQDGFSFDPAFETLENAELRASIGAAKPTLGLENPTGSLNHYLRHSGVEGQKPGYAKLLKAAMGVETVFAAEETVGASATKLVLPVGAGRAAQMKRGQFLLIKDATNGFSIRPVLSVDEAEDEVTLGFAVPVAPASGVKLGKCVLYEPANEGHPTLTAWLYRANGGSIEMVSGVRVTEMSFDFSAGQFINGSFSLGGIEYFFNPIEVGVNNDLDFEDSVGPIAVSIPARTYKDPKELAAAIQTAMNSGGSDDTFTVVYNDLTGKFNFTSDGTVFKLLWATGVNLATSIGSTIGAGAADQTGVLTYALSNSIALAAPHTPAFDSADPLVAKSNEFIIGDAEEYKSFKASTVSVSISNTKKDINDVTSDSGRAGSLFTGRQVTISATALLEKYDADKFNRFNKGTNTPLLYVAGQKSGGNWVPGNNVALYVPNATITAFTPSDDEGLSTLQMEFTAYVDDGGEGEIFLGFV